MMYNEVFVFSEIKKIVRIDSSLLGFVWIKRCGWINMEFKL